jgi:hypothetical protein
VGFKPTIPVSEGGEDGSYLETRGSVANRKLK